MAIPKIIYQTFKTNQLPLITQWHIWRLKRKNPEYEYQFYNDKRISEFIKKEFEKEIFDLYNKINIGAAKADFFRYAILYKKGGIYLDIDSLIVTKLDKFILPSDVAIISLESNLKYYVQWGLIFEAGHPFLKKTLDIVVENLKTNKYPNDVHQMTGPSAYTKAINECKQADSQYNYYREVGVDYEGNLKFHYRFSKFFIYGVLKKNHWKVKQNKNPIIQN